MTPEDFLIELHKPNSELFHEEINMVVNLDDQVLEMERITHIYSQWLKRVIQGFYEYKAEKRLTGSRDSRRDYARFMNKWNYMIEKTNDKDLVWTFKAGRDEDNLQLIARLEILKANGTE